MGVGSRDGLSRTAKETAGSDRKVDSDEQNHVEHKGHRHGEQRNSLRYRGEKMEP